VADFRIFGARRGEAPGTPSSCPRHRVLFRPWIRTTRHLAGSARSPQSSSCSRWRLSEGSSTVRPGRAAIAIPSLPTARRPPRHRPRSAVRSVGASRAGRCAGSFASSHNWLKRGRSARKRWGTGGTAGVVPCATAGLHGLRRWRSRAVPASRRRLRDALTTPAHSGVRSANATCSRGFAARVVPQIAPHQLRARRRVWPSKVPTSMVGFRADLSGAPFFGIAIHKIDYRAL
jgi:hypothetical protein